MKERLVPLSAHEVYLPPINSRVEAEADKDFFHELTAILVAKRVKLDMEETNGVQ